MAAYGPLVVPSWAIGVVFTFFLIVTLIWDKMLHAVEHSLHKRNKPALHKALHGLKDEILAVGMIVLILPLFENHLMKICVPKAWSDNAPGYNPHGWSLRSADIPTPYTTNLDFPANAGASYSSYPAQVAAGRKLLADPAPPATATPSSTTSDSSNNQTFSAGTAKYTTTSGSKNSTYDKSTAAGGKGDKADAAKEAVCAPGLIQLFPAEALHGIHIFIALTALVHVFYAAMCLMLCTLRMRGWWKWEMEAQKSAAIPTNKRLIKSVGRNPTMHILMSIANTFVLPISRSLYLSMRRLFVEGLKQEGQLDELPLDFPYFAYVQEAMQYSFCDVVAVGPLVWLFAIIQLIVPYGKRIWLTIALCCFTILLMIAAGAKLHSLVVHLAARSVFLYSDNSLHPGQSGGSKAVDPEAADSHVTFDTSAGNGKAGMAKLQRQQQRGVQAAKDVPHGRPDQQHKPHSSVQGPAAVSDNVLQRFKTYVARANLQDDLPSMFWFHRPKLLLTFFKIAYFQAAFCLTLVLFALWKDNQFLPDQVLTPDVVIFFVLLSLNIALSFFMSTCVLPVYAIVSVADKGAFVAAGEFADRDMRHQQSLKREAHQGDSFNEQQHQQAMAVLHKLHSQVHRMQNLAAEVRNIDSSTPANPAAAAAGGGQRMKQGDELLSPNSSLGTLGTWDSVGYRDGSSSKRAHELWGSVRQSVRY